MKSIIEKADLNGKKVLLRLDLNVPIDKVKITDSTRIDKIIPTLEFLVAQNANIIIISHIGRPNGKIVDKLSLKPICEDLSKKLNQNIRLISNNIKEINLKEFLKSNNEKIIMLENIRFYSEEEKNNKRNKGTITFFYHDAEQLNRIIDIIKSNY